MIFYGFPAITVFEGFGRLVLGLTKTKGTLLETAPHKEDLAANVTLFVPTGAIDKFAKSILQTLIAPEGKEAGLASPAAKETTGKSCVTVVPCGLNTQMSADGSTTAQRKGAA